MNNIEEYSNIFLSLLSTSLGAIIPMIITWIGKNLKKEQNIYADHIYLYCNYAIFNKVMSKIVINIIVLVIITIPCMAISIYIYPLNLIAWVGIYVFIWVLQIMITGKGYYGLDRYGTKKDYTFSIYLFVMMMDIDIFIVPTKYPIIGFIIEALLIFFLACYVTTIKKVKYCEHVTLILKHGKTKIIAIENFRLEQDGSVIIHNQNKSNVQISSNLIKKKKAVYSAEYIQWTNKIHNFNMESKLMKENNNDVRWIWVILIAVIPIVISIIDLMDLCLKGNDEISRWLISIASNDNMLSDLFSQQMTISTIFIAVASLIVNNINDRFVGTSTKYILFKKFIFYFNYITIILILLALNVSSFVAYLLQSKWGLIISFIVSIIWLFDLLKLTYYLLSKKSRIYFIILKKLDAELEKKKNLVVYSTLVDKLDALVEKNTINDNDLIHDSYFVEEMLILYKMSSIACILSKDDHKTIDNAKKYYFSREERSGDQLRKLFDQYKGSDCKNALEWIKEELDKK